MYSYRDTLIEALDTLIQTRHNLFTEAVNVAMKGEYSYIDEVFEEGDVFCFELSHFDNSKDISLQKIINLIKQTDATIRSIMNLNAIDYREIVDENPTFKND